MTIKFYVGQRVKDEALRKDAEGNDVTVTCVTVRLALAVDDPGNAVFFPDGDKRGSLELCGLDPVQAESLVPGTLVDVTLT